MKRASNQFMLDLCDLIITETADCAEHLHGLERINSDQICFLLFDRMFQGLSSFKILMSFEEKRKIVYNGAAIIMRSLLSDSVYGYQLSNIINSDNELEVKVRKLNELFHKALVDGHIHSLKYIDRLQDSGKITKKDLIDINATIEKVIKKINPEFTVEKLRQMKAINITSQLKSQAKDDPIFDRIENNYKTFSQVEHFSGFYENWLAFDLEKRFEMLIESVFLCGHHIVCLINFLARQTERQDFFTQRFLEFN